MLEITITHRVDAPDLIGAINNLADALSQGRTAQPATTPVVELLTPIKAAADPNAIVPATVPAPAPVSASAAAAVPVTAAPVTSPAITFDMIVAAGSQLLDAGRMNELLALLAQYGVQAITQLKPEQYESVAVALRGLGAKI